MATVKRSLLPWDDAVIETAQDEKTGDHLWRIGLTLHGVFRMTDTAYNQITDQARLEDQIEEQLRARAMDNIYGEVSKRVEEIVKKARAVVAEASTSRDCVGNAMVFEVLEDLVELHKICRLPVYEEEEDVEA